MSSTITTALECRLGLGRVALPSSAIEQLGELCVGPPLPFGERVGCSVGLWVGEPVIAISLTHHDSAVSRTTNGALLAIEGSVRWAFEIDEPIGLIDITSFGVPSPSMRWRRSATTSDGRTVQFINIAEMIEDLRGHTRQP